MMKIVGVVDGEDTKNGFDRAVKGYTNILSNTQQSQGVCCCLFGYASYVQDNYDGLLINMHNVETWTNKMTILILSLNDNDNVETCTGQR